MKPRRSARKSVDASQRRSGFVDWSVVFRGTLIFSCASLCLAGRSLANPLGEKVRSGSADFSRSGNNLQIQQNSQSLIVDWNDFSIARGEGTRFVQLGANAVALNRVQGGNP